MLANSLAIQPLQIRKGVRDGFSDQRDGRLRVTVGAARRLRNDRVDYAKTGGARRDPQAAIALIGEAIANALVGWRLL